MLKNIWKGKKTSGLIYEALEETCRMLKQEEGMFHAACTALLAGEEPGVDVVHEDEDIDVGERMVRRLVFEHLTLNPDRELPTSLVLLSIVHDVERIGDYTKSLLHLSRWRSEGFDAAQYATACKEIRVLIDPMFGKALAALRESDSTLAREVMREHKEIKTRTNRLIESILQDKDGGQANVICSIATQFLRRISAHLSNIASSIANPFDRMGGEES
ncbi:MAG: PhoU domain-containing protein [bacterium]|nr:PhoU domain-containing protein [bacterium]